MQLTVTYLNNVTNEVGQLFIELNFFLILFDLFFIRFPFKIRPLQLFLQLKQISKTVKRNEMSETLTTKRTWHDKVLQVEKRETKNRQERREKEP